MADGPGGEKTEKATPKRRLEARKEGQVARSMEVNSALAILAGFGLLALWGPHVLDRIDAYFAAIFIETRYVAAGGTSLAKVAGEGLRTGLSVTIPFLLVMMFAGVLANLIQNRFRITPEVIKPRLKRINPINGFKQKFSPQQLVELVKNVVKMIAVAVPALIILWARRDDLLMLTAGSAGNAAMTLGLLIVQLGLTVGFIYIFIGVLDWFWQKWRYEKQIRMTKYEVKQEMRQQDMAPELKAQQRRRQREAARSRMLAAVPEADVVITNPTHFSIALAYDPDDGAPRVVAKGADLLARRIRELADEHGVMRVENPPLARALYAQVEVGQYIPGEMFAAVAEVLAFVFRAQGRRAGSFAPERSARGLEHA